MEKTTAPEELMGTAHSDVTEEFREHRVHNAKQALAGDRPSREDIDENDPRNWNPWKKRMVFLALMSSSILADGHVNTLSLTCFF